MFNNSNIIEFFLFGFAYLFFNFAFILFVFNLFTNNYNILFIF